jgi:DNA polymerase III epsilon subunit-like protein
MRFIAVDTETTGLVMPMPIEIAAEELFSGATFCEKIRPTKAIDPGATAVHGLSEDSLKDCRSLKEVLADFLEFVGHEPVTFIAHNAAFDKKVLLNGFQ